MFKNKRYQNFFYIWIVCLIFLVGSIIVVGGLTRLTESGLSITKWEIFRGFLPPLNQEQWEKYFLEYKTIPQYILLNAGMSLQEFKFIFLWEYFHRLLGRIIGLFFLIPFIFFIYKRMLNKYLTRNLNLIFFLIIAQGTIGWYMVKSGLVENISVSHYRLAIHLFIAFIIFSLLIWIFMNCYFKKKKSFFLFISNFFFF